MHRKRYNLIITFSLLAVLILSICLICSGVIAASEIYENDSNKFTIKIDLDYDYMFILSSNYVGPDYYIKWGFAGTNPSVSIDVVLMNSRQFSRLMAGGNPSFNTLSPGSYTSDAGVYNPRFLDTYYFFFINIDSSMQTTSMEIQLQEVYIGYVFFGTSLIVLLVNFIIFFEIFSLLLVRTLVKPSKPSKAPPKTVKKKRIPISDYQFEPLRRSYVPWEEPRQSIRSSVPHETEEPPTSRPYRSRTLYDPIEPDQRLRPGWVRPGADRAVGEERGGAPVRDTLRPQVPRSTTQIPRSTSQVPGSTPPRVIHLPERLDQPEESSIRAAEPQTLDQLLGDLIGPIESEPRVRPIGAQSGIGRDIGEEIRSSSFEDTTRSQIPRSTTSEVIHLPERLDQPEESSIRAAEPQTLDQLFGDLIGPIETEATPEPEDPLDFLESTRELIEPFEIQTQTSQPVVDTEKPSQLPIAGKPVADMKVSEKISEQVDVENLGFMALESVTKGDLDEALDFLERAVEVDSKTGNEFAKVTDLTNLAIACQLKGELKMSLNHLDEVLGICRKIKDKQGEAVASRHIGLIYHLNDDEKLALVYFQHAEEIFKEVGAGKSEAASLGDISLTYYTKFDIPLAIEQLTKAREILNNVVPSFSVYSQINLALMNYMSEDCIPSFENIRIALSTSVTIEQFGDSLNTLIWIIQDMVKNENWREIEGIVSMCKSGLCSTGIWYGFVMSMHDYARYKTSDGENPRTFYELGIKKLPLWLKNTLIRLLKV